ncbi:DUF554 domain-containing protein [uncultured Intestinimonas sp.]|uniref:DUF554 domain-containing protein n=1 Tax=uncultured Intestinimonas sp. TaxID=1689265 RepID=UPI0025CEF79D|nr:DUF554 domain-containing protein [uncultured Intestinimonas sp.]
MLATIINAVLVLIGSILGVLFKNRIGARFNTILTHALGLCVLGIGVTSAIATENTLCVIVCMVLGTILGEAIRIEDRLDAAGELLRRKLAGGESGSSSRFTEGFVTAAVLFCVGSMAIMGSMEAGIQGKYDILISKGVIDGVTSITLASAMGVGVAFSVLPLAIYQGGLTLLFAQVGPFLDSAAITEMSAVGGTIIVGIAINMLGLGKAKIRVGNMLPAIFLPLLYLPVSQWLSGLAG